MARDRRRRGDSAPRDKGRRRGRFAAFALGIGVVVVIVFALVFSVAFGTRGVAVHASALHNADEALRSATVARAQAGMATHLTALVREFDFSVGDNLEVSLGEARFALTDLSSALEGLDHATDGLDSAILSSSTSFIATVEDILDAIESGDGLLAQDIATESLDQDFRALVGSVVLVRDFEASEVAASSALMGRIGDVARFLVAFLVPTGAILMYRELSRRQSRQKELEVRLETEQEIGKARDEFVANASHELRTPLTSIFGLAHLLEEDEALTTSETAPELVGMIISETHDLGRMVDDLLTTARLDAGALHYQFENLTITEELREVVGPIERSGRIVTVQAQPALVRSDRLRLRQVVRNLLSNAAKYGGDNLRLQAGIVNGWYEIRVEDDGQGIPDELRDRLFQRYLHQGDMPLILGSVGLGLSIVRALTEGMGGAVWYERRGGWTSFVVRVPLASDSAPSQYEESSATPGVPGRRRAAVVPTDPLGRESNAPPVQVTVSSAPAPVSAPTTEGLTQPNAVPSPPPLPPSRRSSSPLPDSNNREPRIPGR